MNTERLTELLTEFEAGVSHKPGNGLDSVLEYQDIIGQSNMAEIREFEETLKKGQPKKHFVWVNFLALSEDMAMDVLKNTVVHRWKQGIADEYENYISERENTVFEKENRFNNARKWIFKKINKLNTSNAKLKYELNAWRERALSSEKDYYASCQRFHSINKKAEKYDIMRSLLTD